MHMLQNVAHLAVFFSTRYYSLLQQGLRQWAIASGAAGNIVKCSRRERIARLLQSLLPQATLGDALARRRARVVDASTSHALRARLERCFLAWLREATKAVPPTVCDSLRVLSSH